MKFRDKLSISQPDIPGGGVAILNTALFFILRARKTQHVIATLNSFVFFKIEIGSLMSVKPLLPTVKIHSANLGATPQNLCLKMCETWKEKMFIF